LAGSAVRCLDQQKSTVVCSEGSSQAVFFTHFNIFAKVYRYLIAWPWCLLFSHSVFYTSQWQCVSRLLNIKRLWFSERPIDLVHYVYLF